MDGAYQREISRVCPLCTCHMWAIFTPNLCLTVIFVEVKIERVLWWKLGRGVGIYSSGGVGV